MLSPLRWLAREAGLRFLGRRKAAFTVAVLTMALALGANTIVFSALKTFLFASVGVPDADRLLLIWPTRDVGGHSTHFAEAYPNYDLIRRTQHAFTDITVTNPAIASWDDAGESRPLRTSRVTASFFATMRVFPMLGRAFTQSEQEPVGTRLVVISYGLWKSAMAGDPSVVGRTMRLDGQPYTLIGVMPEGFTQPASTADIWIPLDVPPGDRVAITGARHYYMYGRLDAAHTAHDALIDAKDFTTRTVAANADNREFRYEMKRVRDDLLDGVDSTVVLIQEGAGVLLLLAVLNVASLLLAWGFERRQELAVRQALGAGGGRVVRILLLQSLVVVGTGAVVGVGVTGLAIPWLRGLDLGRTLTLFTSRISLDGGVLAVSAVVAVIAGLVAGVLPAWFSRRSDIVQSLRAGGRSATLSPAALRWQQGMVVVQAALSVVILGAAALIGLSFRNLQHVRGGFVAHGAIVARVPVDARRYADSASRATLGRAVVDNLSREPSIAEVAFTSTLPVGDNPWSTYFFVPQPDGSLSKEPALFQIRRVSPNYLQTIGIPLVTGRQFDGHDDTNAPPVTIVSQRLAKRLWPGESAIGKRIYRVVPGSKVPGPLTVVGVAGNVIDEGASAPPSETVYIPWAQLSTNTLSLVVRPHGSDEAAISALQHGLRVTDPLMVAHDVAKLDALVDRANVLPRLESIILLVFAAAATLMAMLGCYGVMRQVVSTREREYAMRLVFGASPAELGRSVLRQVARLTVPGVGAGLVTVILLGGVLKRFVFGVDPRSAVVLSAVSLAMLVIGIAAALPSVVRAMRVDVRRSITP